jgi:hypothetical protein
VAGLLILMEMKKMVCSVHRISGIDAYSYQGFDDVIYPVDYRVAGHIVDDDMHNIMYVPWLHVKTKC